MRKEALRVHNLCKSSLNRDLLSNLNLNLYEGDVLCVIGLHDSGKSLLLNILNGSESYDSGAIFFYEDKISQSELKKTKSIQLIREKSALVQTMTVLENIFLIKRHRHHKLFIKWSNLEQQLIRFIKELDMDIDINQKIADFTPAQQHLIEIIKAYILGSKIILIDNIIFRYTSSEHKNLSKLIHILKNKNVSFIITGYQFSLVKIYTDWILFLSSGRSIKTLKSSDISDIEENKILLNNLQHKEINKSKKNSREVIFEARNISVGLSKNISFEIRKGEIVVIIDLHHTTNTNLTSAILCESGYSGNFLVDDVPVKCVSDKDSKVYFADYSKVGSEINSIKLSGNLCLSAYPRISKFGFISPRQEKQILKDFLKLYHDNGFTYEFDLNNLSQPESMAIYLFRILLQRWKLLFCANPEVLFSFETINVIKNQLHDMTENGRSICFLASTIEPYSDLADRFYLVDDNKIVGEYSYNELQNILVE